jgi:hypothetical protein
LSTNPLLDYSGSGLIFVKKTFKTAKVACA